MSHYNIKLKLYKCCIFRYLQGKAPVVVPASAGMPSSEVDGQGHQGSPTGTCGSIRASLAPHRGSMNNLEASSQPEIALASLYPWDTSPHNPSARLKVPADDLGELSQNIRRPGESKEKSAVKVVTTAEVNCLWTTNNNANSLSSVRTFDDEFDDEDLNWKSDKNYISTAHEVKTNPELNKNIDQVDLWNNNKVATCGLAQVIPKRSTEAEVHIENPSIKHTGDSGAKDNKAYISRITSTVQKSKAR